VKNGSAGDALGCFRAAPGARIRLILPAAGRPS